MRYLILCYYDNTFEIVDGKKELERRLNDVSESTVSEGRIRVYNYNDLEICERRLRTKPAWTVE